MINCFQLLLSTSTCAPKGRDYDIIFLHMPGTIGGKLLGEFDTALGEPIEMYEFKEVEGPAVGRCRLTLSNPC